MERIVCAVDTRLDFLTLLKPNRSGTTKQAMSSFALYFCYTSTWEVEVGLP